MKEKIDIAYEKAQQNDVETLGVAYGEIPSGRCKRRRGIKDDQSGK